MEQRHNNVKNSKIAVLHNLISVYSTFARVKEKFI